MTAFIERIYNLVRLVCVFRSFTSCASSMAATRPRDRNTNGNRNTVHRRQQQRPPIGMEPTLADVLSNLKAHRERQRQRQRQLQTANVNEFLLDDEAIYNSSNTTSSTHNNDEEAGIVSSPYQDCICKGAELLPEKVTTMPLFFGNATCSEIQEYILPLMITVDQCGYSDIAGALFAQCCTTFHNRPRYQCENTIHKQIITQNDENNVNVPPIVENGRPVIVKTDLIFEDFGKIDVILGTAEIVMSIDMVWHDPRLAWTITNDTCADYVSVYAGFDAETTQIWVPDLDLANMKSGVQHWASVPADVFSDGTVAWRHYGQLEALCVITGLGAIPYDTLGCQLLFIGRSRFDLTNSVAYVHKNESSVSISDFGNAEYKEFHIVPELFEKGYTWYHNSKYAQALYLNIFFRRATRQYFSTIVVPTVILTYVSFLVFLLDMRVGERLGFGMALALVIVAQQIITASMIPISYRKLWIDKFITWSFYWVIFGVVQSVLIGFLYYLQEDRQSKLKGQRLSIVSKGSIGEMAETTENDFAIPPPLVGTDSPQVQKIEHWFYRFSLRKVDMICLVFTVVTYTIFIIGMYFSNHNGLWIGGNDSWETESSIYAPNQYVNGDPNSR